MSTDKPLIKDAPAACHKCGKPLCLRKQVINLALGHDEVMECLICLGQSSGRSPEEVLINVSEYALSRECFAKEWKKYTGLEDCPDPLNCFPQSCFAQNKE